MVVYFNHKFSKLFKDDEYIETENLVLNGVGVLKDYYFDLASRKTDPRVFGFSIFTEDTVSKETKEFLFYYPTDLRPILLEKKIRHKDPNISNLDDLLFFSAYGEIVYEHIWGNEKSPKQFHPNEANNYLDFSKEIKIQIVEDEHSYWLGI